MIEFLMVYFWIDEEGKREREREREGALCLWWCIEKDVYDDTRKRAEILFLKEQE